MLRFAVIAIGVGIEVGIGVVDLSLEQAAVGGICAQSVAFLAELQKLTAFTVGNSNNLTVGIDLRIAPVAALRIESTRHLLQQQQWVDLHNS